MKRTIPVTLMVVLLIGGLQPLRGQEITFKATVDRNVIELGEVITLTLTVSGNTAKIPKPKFPEIDDFSVLSRGSSRNFSFVNGKMQSSVSYTYSLVAKREGTFTIDACEIVLKGKVYRTAPIEVEVVAQKEVKGDRVREIVREEGADDIFIETLVDKEKVFVGEQVILTFRLLSAVRIMGNPQYVPPAADGFWREDLGKERQCREIINGREYHVNELTYALFPLTPGEKHIGEAQLNVVIAGIFSDPFDFGLSSGTKRELRSKPITIQVISLPEKPADFGGGVGDFDIQEQLQQDTVKQNEPLTITTIVQGNGNIREVSLPDIDIPGFRIYHSGSSVDTEESGGKLQGTKTFRTVLIPAKSGDFEIPERSFVYFNPLTGKYVTKVLENLSFTVIPSEKEAASERIFSALALEKVGEDVHFIKMGGEIRDDDGMGWVRYLFVLNGVLLCALLAIVVLRELKGRREVKGDLMRKRDALRCALKTTRKANHAAKRGKVAEAYELLHRAILQFFADKCDMSIWGVTEDEIMDILRSSSGGEENSRELADVLNACNRARYSTEKPDMKAFETDLEKTERTLRAIKI
jgi:hypothetical protein